MITKQSIIRVQTAAKLTPKLGTLKKTEGIVYKNLSDGRKNLNPKYQVYDLVRTADLKRTFSKADTTNWSCKLYRITEIIYDTIPSYQPDNFPERYNGALLKKTILH